MGILPTGRRIPLPRREPQIKPDSQALVNPPSINHIAPANGDNMDSNPVPGPTNRTGKPTLLKVLVFGGVIVVALVALFWLAGFAHAIIDVVVRIIRFFAG